MRLRQKRAVLRHIAAKGVKKVKPGKKEKAPKQKKNK